jgi:predicted DCC family thiol-disulfide oxidoreductase YuxK
MLTIFYDSTCPLCAKEMTALMRYDQRNAIELVDLSGGDWQARYPDIELSEAMRVLHAYEGQKLLLGLDVTAAAWKAVGKKPWVQVLRWPVVRWFADKFYIFFANNRYRISGLLLGQQRCQNDACAIGSDDLTNKEQL